jgi:hypothetical protein
LIRNPVEIEPWIDRKANQTAIAELGLQDFWTPRSGQAVADKAV